jgi:hypothetical protein
LLLSRGHVIFHGTPIDAAPFFVSSPFGFNQTPYDNPADFLTDISGCYITSKEVEYGIYSNTTHLLIKNLPLFSIVFFVVGRARLLPWI